MKLSKQKLTALKKASKGNLAEIAELSGVSISTVSNVLNGRTNNEKVIKSAIAVRNIKIEERKSIEAEI